MFFSFSGSFRNMDTRTRNNNRPAAPCSLAQHSQDHTSTTSHQKNNLAQYWIVTLRLLSPVSPFSKAVYHLADMTYISFPQKIFGLSFAISQVCYLDDHTLPRRKNPCLCLICQVILLHSRTLLREVLLTKLLVYSSALHTSLWLSLDTKPNPTANNPVSHHWSTDDQDQSTQEEEAGQHWLTGHSYFFPGI